MSSGRTHFRVALVFDFVATPAIFLTVDPDAVSYALAGLLVGTFCTPDVRDIDATTYPGYVLSRIPVVGRFLKYALRLFWFPLASLLPHRSKFSHMPVLGTVVAFAYALGLITFLTRVIPAVGSFVQDMGWTLGTPGLRGLTALFTVWLAHDLLHILFDMRSPFRRRHSRR